MAALDSDFQVNFALLLARNYMCPELSAL